MRATFIAAVLLVAGCGGDPLAGARPIGTGPGFRPGSLSPAVARSAPVGGLSCSRAPARGWAHLELFARGRVLLLPAGVGVAPPRRTDGAYVRGGHCRYPVWTDEPTGLVALAREDLTVGDLFAVWGRPLTRDRLAGFRGRVTAHVDGRRWRHHPAAIPLRHHAQVVLQAGGPPVPPHAAYTFPAGR